MGYYRPYQPFAMDQDEDYYVGVDVGIGSARACVIDRNGDIKAIVSKMIQTWEPHTGYYVGHFSSEAVSISFFHELD